MQHPRFHHPKLIIAALVLAFLTIIWAWFIIFDSVHNVGMQYGVSFDPEYAGSLKINPVDAYRTIVDEWGFKHVRLSVHWDKVEPMPSEFNFDEVEYYLNESQKYGAKVILAIGNKTPRWPECHSPAWTNELTREGYMKSLRTYIETTVTKFKDHPAIEMWQVENEPFLAFGECYLLTHAELAEEVALVKSIDPVHPVMVADSGELSTWYFTSKTADFFGTTLYRVVWNKYIGYWNYDWVPAVMYRWKMRLVGRSPATAYVVELQAEPWSPSMRLNEVPVYEQEKSMNLERLKKNIDFAQRVGVARTYFWGAEWWYWLKVNGYNNIPDYISSLQNK